MECDDEASSSRRPLGPFLTEAEQLFLNAFFEEEQLFHFSEEQLFRFSEE